MYYTTAKRFPVDVAVAALSKRFLNGLLSSLTFEAGIAGPEQVSKTGVVGPAPVRPRDEAHAPELSEVVQTTPAVGREGCGVRVSDGADDVNVLELHVLGSFRDFVRPTPALAGKLAASI